MPNANLIDEIVREVLRRLSQSDLRDGTVLRRDSPSNTATLATTASSAKTLCLSGRVISHAMLDGQLSGVKRVQVGERAVVTPLAKDLLREKRIPLERSERKFGQRRIRRTCTQPRRRVRRAG